MSSVLPLFSFIVVVCRTRKKKGEGREENYARTWAAPILCVWICVCFILPQPPLTLFNKKNLPVTSWWYSYKCHVALTTIVVILNLVDYRCNPLLLPLLLQAVAMIRLVDVIPYPSLSSELVISWTQNCRIVWSIILIRTCAENVSLSLFR